MIAYRCVYLVNYMDSNTYLDISGIQHFCFCKKQWALIHIERQWLENKYTTEGHIIHEHCHDETFTEKRKDLIISRGMPIHSENLHVKGVCDVVEFHEDTAGVPIFGRDGLWKLIPIEYKRGAPKLHNADKLQLCCQAICLEEMMCCEITFGYIYYNSINKREKIIFDSSLRSELFETISEMKEYFDRGYTPKISKFKGCDSCSLYDICLPKIHDQSVSKYIMRMLTEVDK